MCPAPLTTTCVKLWAFFQYPAKKVGGSKTPLAGFEPVPALSRILESLVLKIPPAFMRAQLIDKYPDGSNKDLNKDGLFKL